MKRTITIMLLTVALLVAFTTPAAASFGGDLATNLSPAACGGGTLVVQATEAVRNDIDSGQAGNNWAYDDLVRSINVWHRTDDTYCAIVGYAGAFTTVAGRSPGNTANNPAGIRGFFYGGHRSPQFHGNSAYRSGVADTRVRRCRRLQVRRGDERLPWPCGLDCAVLQLNEWLRPRLVGLGVSRRPSRHLGQCHERQQRRHQIAPAGRTLSCTDRGVRGADTSP